MKYKFESWFAYQRYAWVNCAIFSKQMFESDCGGLSMKDSLWRIFIFVGDTGRLGFFGCILVFDNVKLGSWSVLIGIF